MVDLYVGPSETVVLPLLQIERVEFVGLRRGARHQPIEHGRVSLDARAENTENPKSVSALARSDGGRGFDIIIVGSRCDHDPMIFAREEGDGRDDHKATRRRRRSSQV